MTSADEPDGAVEIPGPEPEWTLAAYQQGRKNPVFQYFMWDQAIGDFREIAFLRVRFPDLANRLKLIVEESTAAQLGPIEGAFLSIQRVGYAVSRWKDEPVGVVVYLHRAETTPPEEALDRLLEVLGVDRAAVEKSVDAEKRWSSALPISDRAGPGPRS